MAALRLIPLELRPAARSPPWPLRPEANARSSTTTFTLSDLPRPVRRHPLASAGACGDCYSFSYSPVKGPKWLLGAARYRTPDHQLAWRVGWLRPCDLLRTALAHRSAPSDQQFSRSCVLTRPRLALATRLVPTSSPRVPTPSPYDLHAIYTVSTSSPHDLHTIRLRSVITPYRSAYL